MVKENSREWKVYLLTEDSKEVLHLKVPGYDTYDAKRHWWDRMGPIIPEGLTFVDVLPGLRVKRLRN